MDWIIALLARLALLIMWVSTSLVSRAFQGGWLLPLLGLLFLPLTTLVYVFISALYGDVSGWSWFWVVLAVLLDLSAHSSPARRHAMRARNGRTEQPQEVKW